MASTTERERGGGRLSRHDWVGAALDALVESGIEGVRIDRLCRALGVTKGSFYHHFDGREDLLHAVAGYWADTQPREAIAELTSREGDALAQLVAATRMVGDRDIGRRDHAMRAWAAADERAARSVRQADEQILALLEGVLDRMGVPRDEIQPLSRVLFFTALGAHDAPVGVDGPSRRSLSRYLLRLVRDRAEGATRASAVAVSAPRR